MKLRTAIFFFDNYKVIFSGGIIEIQEETKLTWRTIQKRTNNWTSRATKEDDGVMNRCWKPRVKDAARLLNQALKESRP